MKIIYLQKFSLVTDFSSLMGAEKLIMVERSPKHQIMTIDKTHN